VLKSTETKHSKSRSSSSSQRSSAGSGCLSSAFTFDGLGAGDFQLDGVGVDQSEMNELLETLESEDGAALMADLTDMSFSDSLDVNAGMAAAAAAAAAESSMMMRLTPDVNNESALSQFDSSDPAALNGE